MSTIHLSTPATPEVAQCGDESAKRFTSWRWKATCAMCKAATAAVSYEKAHFTTMAYRTDLPIRYSKVVEFLRSKGETQEALIEFQRDKNIACSFCPTCGFDLTDPIALFDSVANRVAFACPACSDAALREQWKREGA